MFPIRVFVALTKTFTNEFVKLNLIKNYEILLENEKRKLN